jgi:hypothetical protein
MTTVNRGIGVTPGYLDREDLRKLLSATFKVPTFQRGYAWEDTNVDDYVNDLLEHNSAATSGRRYDAYFFGAVVTIRRSTGLGRGDEELEVIDGQQRLTTFFLTIASIQRRAAELEKDAAALGDKATKRAAKTLREAMDTFLADDDDGTLRFVPGGVDDAYYREVMTSGAGATLPGSAPYAHRRLRAAAEKLWTDLVVGLLDGATSAIEMVRRLDRFAKAFLEGCYVIHAGSEVEVDAYRLFLVLNDRGLVLTEANLLKTRTLDLLRNHRAESDIAQRAWELIVSVKPQTQRAFLRAYWSMCTGRRPQSRDLHRDFQSEWFKERPKNRAEAKQVADRVTHMADAFSRFRSIADGRWPFTTARSDAWTRDRLGRLIHVLGSDTSIPLLMSLSYGSESRFASAMLYLERFIFRYNVSGGHKSTLGNRVFAEAGNALANSTWTVSDLRKALAPVAGRYATDERFKVALQGLRYRGSRILVRHLLTTLDDYFGWYQRGASGEPRPSKMRIFTLDRGDIDHIYPEKPKAGSEDADLDKVRDNIGNLAYLDESDNRSLKNEDFSTKQSAVYATAAAQLTRELSDTKAYPGWAMPQFDAHRDKVVEMSLKVFSIEIA